MLRVDSQARLEASLGSARAAGRRIALVPTMGNLHQGHLSLVRQARACGDVVVVTIFVNPFQFGPDEDFSTYPRTLDADTAALAALDVDVLYLPGEHEVYPRGPRQSTRVEVPGLGEVLDGERRPGFFRGVATVVNVLFGLVRPDVALFGTKDYQQLLVIRRMVADLHLPVEVIAVPTVREVDGLAMSSRNGYLSDAERLRAPALYRALGAAREELVAGGDDFAAIEARAVDALHVAGLRPDYVAIRDPGDLSIPPPGARPLVVLGAAWLGRARLIDNVAV